MMHRPMIGATVRACAFAWVSGLALAGQSAPAGDARDRPAVMARVPQRAVLIAAAQAGPRIVAVGERGIVVLSDDGGKTWQQASVPTSVTLVAVRFADPQRGYAVGHGGTVLVTEDGGRSWARRADGRRLAEVALQAARASGNEGAIKDAQRLVTEGPDKPLLDLLVLSGQRLVVVGAYGFAFASEDGGAHWTSWMPRIPNPKGLHLYAIRQAGNSLLMVGEQGLAVLSRDAGQTFTRLATPYPGSFFTAELPGGQHMVVAGLRGNVWQSADAGATWTPLATPMPASITASAQGADGRLLLANQAGFVLALQGPQFVPVNHQPLPPLNGVLQTADGALLALSIQGPIPVLSTSGPTGSSR